MVRVCLERGLRHVSKKQYFLSPFQVNVTVIEMFFQVLDFGFESMRVAKYLKYFSSMGVKRNARCK